MPLSPSCKRGDVVLVLFPNSDLRTAKPRPVLVVQADHLEIAVSRVIGSLPMAEVDHALRHTLGL